MLVADSSPFPVRHENLRMPAEDLALSVVPNGSLRAGCSSFTLSTSSIVSILLKGSIAARRVL